MAKNGMDGSNGMSPRKSMAMGKSSMGSESFGVDKSLYGAPHPDAKMSHMPLGDNARGVGMPVKHSGNMHPAQAMPDHGPMHIRKG